MQIKVYNPLLNDYITIPKPINRIISIDPASTETIFLLGYGDKIVATDAFSYRPAEAKKKIKIGSYTHVNLELLESLKPDIIFSTNGAQKILTKKLLDLGYNVYPIPLPTNISSILSNILQIGNVLGAYEESRKLYISLLNIMLSNTVHNSLKRPKIYLEFDLGGPITIGFPTHISDAISLVGGKNIFDDNSEAYFEPKEEEILERDPDIIIYEPKRLSEYEKARFYDNIKSRGLSSLLKKPIYFTVGDYLAHMGPSFVTDSIKWLKSVILSTA